MTTEERRLKLMKIEKYKEDLSQERRKTSDYAYILSILAVISVGSGVLSDAPEINKTLSAIFGSLPIFTSPFMVNYLKNLIVSICKSTGLESKIEDLELDLDFDKQSGGKSL